MAQAETQMRDSYEAHLARAREEFQTFLNASPKSSRFVIMHDSDADGVTAGVVLQLALERIGYTNVVRLAPDRERMWVAAIGTFSDLGEKAPFGIIAEAKRRYKAKYLKEATTLVNAARRASEHNPELAARALLAHTSPQALVEAVDESAEALRHAWEEVKAALNEAKKAAPVFSGQVVLVRVNTPCQVHPLIAQSWRTRLPKFIVIAANEGYLPGRVNFSARTSADVNILDFFRSFTLSEGEGDFGHGHDQASGGSLPIRRWNELLDKMGFPASDHAKQV